MEVRLQVEPIVAGLAAKRRTPEDIMILENGIERMPLDEQHFSPCIM
ncbi:MAG: hypothetical protein GY846_15040 [Deltaproteobacteria bacterium]|nr:hypothetical protein [Deltaproteobacteria bacterium]